MARALHLAPAQTATNIKDMERAQLDADLARWKASGGKIQRLAHGDRAPDKIVKRRGKAVLKKPNAGFNIHPLSDKRPVFKDEEE